MTNEDWSKVVAAVSEASMRYGKSVLRAHLARSEIEGEAVLGFVREDTWHRAVVSGRRENVEKAASGALGRTVVVRILDYDIDPHAIDVDRVNAACATAKVTPAHSWCSTCGANKPAHKHEPRP